MPRLPRRDAAPTGPMGDADGQGSAARVDPDDLVRGPPPRGPPDERHGAERRRAGRGQLSDHQSPGRRGRLWGTPRRSASRGPPQSRARHRARARPPGALAGGHPIDAVVSRGVQRHDARGRRRPRGRDRERLRIARAHRSGHLSQRLPREREGGRPRDGHEVRQLSHLSGRSRCGADRPCASHARPCDRRRSRRAPRATAPIPRRVLGQVGRAGARP